MQRRSGFTLIELSIVLVIIGLIVGGVLVGRDLIAAAAIRSQISQIEKYTQAVNTFRGKYAYLPGDIPDPDASRFGFIARGPYAGEGDGNGVIEGIATHAPASTIGVFQGRGETSLFWVDLTTAGLIDGSFTTATAITDPLLVNSTRIALYMPPACIGRSNYVYVYGRTDFFVTAQDYFCLSAVTSFGGGASPSANPGLTVQEAYNIDRKIDDGLPQSGRVTAQYANAPIQTNLPVWAAGGGVQGANGGGLPSQPTTAATPGSSTTCYDNGNSTNAQQYSITQSNGSYVNCALSFMFQ